MRKGETCGSVAERDKDRLKGRDNEFYLVKISQVLTVCMCTQRITCTYEGYTSGKRHRNLLGAALFSGTGLWGTADVQFQLLSFHPI